MTMDLIKTYSELSKLKTFEERFRYLKLDGTVANKTFGYDRYLNQYFYNTPEWKHARNEVILRDYGCDLGVRGYEIAGKIIIHHMNPIRVEDIVYKRDEIFDPEFLVCVKHSTHNAIHYGDESILITGTIERTPNDTIPWKR